MNRVFLLDGMALAYRAYFGLIRAPRMTRDGAGSPPPTPRSRAPWTRAHPEAPPAIPLTAPLRPCPLGCLLNGPLST